MDYLLGSEIDFEKDDSVDGWNISSDMIIEIQEKTMTEKIQMTEEQFDNFYQECIMNIDYRNRDYILKCAKAQGYIKKSELETLVEEAVQIEVELRESEWAEEYYLKHEDCIKYFTPKIKKLFYVIQAFKTKYPEWNK